MISHEHKCIFIHIPKTAGMSIYSFFYPNIKFHHKLPDYERLFGWCPNRKLHMQHATSKQLLETGLITEEQWNSYFKFTFVRNPWDRAYSDYLFIKSFAQVEGSFKDYINKKGRFKDILINNENESYLGDHLLSQTDFFDMNTKFKMDFVGRFENFSQDIQTVISILNIEKEFNIRENYNKNRYKEYSNFYTNSNEKLVKKMFLKDIEKLNYQFEDKRTGLNILKKLL